MEETKRLATFVTKLTYEDLPKNVIEKVKNLTLDQMGCQLAGSTMPWSKAAYEYILEWGGRKEESTIVNYGIKVSAKDAAFINACFGHAFMGDDTDYYSHAHLGAIIIPSVFAVGEKEMIDGKEFIKAVVTGYEVASRIGSAAPYAEGRGFHPGPIFGPFGVAASIGSIYRFNEEQFIDALGIAGSHSCGLMEYSKSGGSVNRLHSGIAAYGGIRSALLVQKGFKGPQKSIEGEKGFLRAFSGESFPEEITKGLGETFRILSIEIKNYCCCGTATSTLDAVSKLKNRLEITPEEIEEIIVEASPITFKMIGSIKEPKDITSAQFSGAFSVALNIIKGNNSFKEYTEEALKDVSILNLSKKVRFVLNEELGKIPNSSNPAKVSIKLKNGKIYNETVLASKGSILNPITKEEVNKKFREFASVILPSNQIDRIFEIIDDLESLRTINELIKLLVKKSF